MLNNYLSTKQYTPSQYLQSVEMAGKMQIKFAGVAAAAGRFAAVIVCHPPPGFGWRTPPVIGFH